MPTPKFFGGLFFLSPCALTGYRIISQLPVEIPCSCNRKGLSTRNPAFQESCEVFARGSSPEGGGPRSPLKSFVAAV